MPFSRRIASYLLLTSSVMSSSYIVAGCGHAYPSSSSFPSLQHSVVWVRSSSRYFRSETLCYLHRGSRPPPPRNESHVLCAPSRPGVSLIMWTSLPLPSSLETVPLAMPWAFSSKLACSVFSSSWSMSFILFSSTHGRSVINTPCFTRFAI
ncbi:hypothetical protein BKA82DRAFT_4173843 [Pisolithus tinctorius]|nr:hypothetical protein BKA82DRAFT_4173843 [Pisolithus tinctorius]